MFHLFSKAVAARVDEDRGCDGILTISVPSRKVKPHRTLRTPLYKKQTADRYAVQRLDGHCLARGTEHERQTTHSKKGKPKLQTSVEPEPKRYIQYEPSGMNERDGQAKEYEAPKTQVFFPVNCS